MFTIYRGEEVIFVPETSIIAIRYNKESATVSMSTKNGKETIHNVDAVNYASSSYPLSLKYVKR